MDWKITHQKVPGSRGWKVLVSLSVSQNEHAQIHRNNHQDLVVVKSDGYDPVYFGDLYPKIGKMLSVPSVIPTDRFIWLLEQGLKQVDRLMVQSKNTIPRDAPIEVEPEPFMFYEHHRFRHHWVQGNQGSGKTTFLSRLIVNDLEKVAAGEASVVILDSQNDDLSQYLPHIERFAPGGDLHGKLVYLEYDKQFPLALNPFAHSHTNVVDLCDFVLRSLIGTDLTSKQNVLYKHALQAVLSVPEANVFTFMELMTDDGHKRLSKQFTTLDDYTKQWMKTRFIDTQFKETREQILWRLEAFVADPLWRNLFSSKEDKLDLLKEMQSGKLIVINTNRGLLKEGRTPFGRFFIHKILHAAEQRMLAQGSKLPVYFYIDEAQDYIENDDNVPDLIDQARKQNIALIISHQRTAKFSQNVISALNNCFIQARLTHWPKATVLLKDDDVHPTVKELIVDELKFEHELQMGRADWQAILDDMHQRFCHNPTPVPPPTQPGTPPAQKRKQKFHTSTP